MGVKTEIASWARDVAPLVDEIVAGGVPADAVDIYRGRNRVVKLTRCGRDINIKAFRKPNVLNRYVYGTLRESKARRSFEFASRLRCLGFDTPEPLAYIEVCDGRRFGDSYYLSQQLEGFRDMRVIDDADDRAMLADQLGALMARMHDAGVWMKDFSQGNVLRRRTGRKQHYEFFLVDINRMEFGVTSRRKLMTNFRTITDDMSFLRILVRAYARHSGRPADEVMREALQAREDFFRKQRIKKFFKNILG